MAQKAALFTARNLKLQTRLAMSILKCGSRKVWLDPNQKLTIAQARTRESVRDLIAQGLITFRPGHRGRKTKIDEVRNHNNPILRRIKHNYADKTNTPTP